MRCPYCHNDENKVLDSRDANDGRFIRRRRKCKSCGKRFTTYEKADTTPRMTVVKKDGSRVPYSKDKMLDGVLKACYKRPVPLDRLELLVSEVEDKQFTTHDREIQSVEIGKALAERLKGIDQVAYVRFASVYYQFGSIEDLLDEIRGLIDTGQVSPPEQGRLFDS